MANIDASGLQDPIHGGTFGNLSVAVKAITLAANAAIADVLRFMRVPAGTRLVDAILFTSADAAGATVKLGYKDVDGGAGDDDFFLSGTSIATAGRFRAATVTPPAKVTEDVYITVIPAGAVIPAATVVTVVLLYEYVGL